MTVIDLRVSGVPQQQGSKNPWGGDANKNLKPWRTSVADAGTKAMSEAGMTKLMDGPVLVEVTFYFPRPKSHYRANGDLKPTAPERHTNTPDADKLQRAVGDALTNIVIRDDKVISDWISRKRYAEFPHARIIITDLSGGSDHDERRSSAAGEGPRADDNGAGGAGDIPLAV